MPESSHFEDRDGDRRLSYRIGLGIYVVNENWMELAQIQTQELSGSTYTTWQPVSVYSCLNIKVGWGQYECKLVCSKFAQAGMCIHIFSCI